MSFENILTEVKEGGVALITLNRPKALNALSSQLMRELEQAIKLFAADPSVGCLVITGSEKAFAAGADIKEMAVKDFAQVYAEDFLTGGWETIAQCRKPLIAAVRGYALGGGCELAMMCDFIIAGESAKFGQPEILLGTLPGLGGTQRLARAVGKAVAMDLCLTGRQMDAAEALRCGLAARVVPDADVLSVALEAANKIASHSQPAVMMVKEAVNAAQETTLQQGLRSERRLFHASFALEDRKEGMTAFAEKRPANWKHR
jgi:enoyl-CoA hydratase